MSENNNVITLQEIAARVNSSNMKEEIVVFDNNFGATERNFFPVRLDYLQIILVTGGQGSFGIDLKQYDVRRNSLLIVQPSNYIYHLKLSQDFSSHVIACSKRIVKIVFPKLTDILPMLLEQRVEPLTQLSEQEAEGLDSFYRFLKTKLEGEPTPLLKQKVICILQAALFEIMDLGSVNAKSKRLNRSRKEELMAKFIILVGENFREYRQLGYYSDKLFISTKYLSSIVREISGRSAAEWIDSFLIMESKVLLKTTDLSIQEIALKLNFSDQSVFGKYFRNNTGQTPTQFRKSN